MKLEELPDDFTVEQFMQLDKGSLDAIPYTRKRWLCQCKGCNNGTTVRDYGLERAWLLDRNSKHAALKPSDYWMTPDHYYLCAKHNKMFKSMKKRFSLEHICRRLFDLEKLVLLDKHENEKIEVVKFIETKS